MLLNCVQWEKVPSSFWTSALFDKVDKVAHLVFNVLHDVASFGDHVHACKGNLVIVAEERSKTGLQPHELRCAGNPDVHVSACVHGVSVEGVHKRRVVSSAATRIV